MPAIVGNYGGDGSGYQSQANQAMAGLGANAGAIGNYGNGLLGSANNFNSVYNNIASYGSAIPISTYVGQAAQDTQGQYGNALGQMQRNLSRMGVNPNSGRFTALQQNWAQALAAAKSGAMTRARSTGALDNMNRMMTVGQFGLGLGNAGVGALATSGGMYGQQAAYYGDVAAGQGGLNAYTGNRRTPSEQSYQDLLDRELAAMGGQGAARPQTPAIAAGGAGYYPGPTSGQLGDASQIADDNSSFSEARARNAQGW